MVEYLDNHLTTLVCTGCGRRLSLPGVAYSRENIQHNIAFLNPRNAQKKNSDDIHHEEQSSTASQHDQGLLAGELTMQNRGYCGCDGRGDGEFSDIVKQPQIIQPLRPEHEPSWLP